MRQAKWISQYHQDRAAEARALAQARRDYIGVEFFSGGEEYIAWPNGEISPAAEYNQWLALQRINAQYGING